MVAQYVGLLVSQINLAINIPKNHEVELKIRVIIILVMAYTQEYVYCIDVYRNLARIKHGK